LESGLPGAGETGTGGVDAAFSEPLGFGGAEVEHDPSTSGASELEPTEVGLSGLGSSGLGSMGLTPMVRPPARWVTERLAQFGASSVLSLFNGPGNEAREFRRMGMQVTTVDPLVSSAWWCRAYVEGAEPARERVVSDWVRLRKDPDVIKRFFPWANRFFTPEETIWLGIWYQAIVKGAASPGEKAIGVTAVFWVMRYWLEWNRRELGFKPMPPVAAFRKYVEEANAWALSLRGRPGSGMALQGAPLQALAKHSCDLLYCYVPPVEGIGSLGLAPQLWEQWVSGDPQAEFPPVEHGELGAPLSVQEHREALRMLVEASGRFASLALAYEGSIADAVWAAVAPHRSVLARETLSVPMPGAEPVQVGLLIAGAAQAAGKTASGA
jgi:hypothetical protein